MKLSVCIQAYNHGQYIAQALDSVLMQRTAFEFEIIVGEDDSSDGTREIVCAYQRRFPERIRLFLNSRENVICVNGRPTGRWNFMNNLQHAQGEYIALLDGDDYWTSPEKLQRQVEFLDLHPECSSCGHRARMTFEDGRDHDRIFSEVPSGRLGIARLLEGNPLPTCSTVFRREAVLPLPEWFVEAPAADYCIHVLCARAGDIMLLDDVMGVYRIHARGAWSGLQPIEQIQSTIQLMGIFRRALGRRWESTIARQISTLYLAASREYESRQQYRNARKAMLDAFRRGSVRYSLRRLELRRLLSILFPYVTGVYRSLRFESQARSVTPTRMTCSGQLLPVSPSPLPEP